MHVASNGEGPDRRMRLHDVALGGSVELSFLHVGVRGEAGEGGGMVAGRARESG